MTHRNAGPPRWIECILGFAASARDRETISGDLLEEYREERLPRHGRRAANFWYARQALSIAGAAVMRRTSRVIRGASVALCLFCLASTLWLVSMEILLRPPRYAEQIILIRLFAVQSLSGVWARRVPRLVILTGAVCVFVLALNSLKTNLRATHFEGYAVLINAAFMLQTAMTALSAVFPPDPSVFRTIDRTN